VPVDAALFDVIEPTPVDLSALVAAQRRSTLDARRVQHPSATRRRLSSRHDDNDAADDNAGDNNNANGGDRSTASTVVRNATKLSKSERVFRRVLALYATGAREFNATQLHSSGGLPAPISIAASLAHLGKQGRLRRVPNHDSSLASYRLVRTPDVLACIESGAAWTPAPPRPVKRRRSSGSSSSSSGGSSTRVPSLVASDDDNDDDDDEVGGGGFYHNDDDDDDDNNNGDIDKVSPRRRSATRFVTPLVKRRRCRRVSDRRRGRDDAGDVSGDELARSVDSVDGFQIRSELDDEFSPASVCCKLVWFVYCVILTLSNCV
jgi:hypothetical protein